MNQLVPPQNVGFYSKFNVNISVSTSHIVEIVYSEFDRGKIGYYNHLNLSNNVFD